MTEVSSHSSLQSSNSCDKNRNHISEDDFSEFHTCLLILFRNSCAGKKPSKTEVDQLVNVAEKYTLASHLFWGLWGLISVSFFLIYFYFFGYSKGYFSLLSVTLCVLQSYVNAIDFDYKEYARQRFQQYWLKKPTLLDSPSITSQDGIGNGSLASLTWLLFMHYY